jgi:hypothetical protein
MHTTREIVKIYVVSEVKTTTKTKVQAMGRFGGWEAERQFCQAW